MVLALFPSTDKQKNPLRIGTKCLLGLALGALHIGSRGKLIGAPGGRQEVLLLDGYGNSSGYI